MSRWLIKTALQRCLSWLPAHRRWNELFQNLVTRSLESSQGQFESTLGDCALLRKKLAAYTNDAKPVAPAARPTATATA